MVRRNQRSERKSRVGQTTEDLRKRCRSRDGQARENKRRTRRRSRCDQRHATRRCRLQTEGRLRCYHRNPPYGERLEDAREVHQLYRKIGTAYKEFPYYSVYMITSYVEFEKAYGRPATKRRKLYNGNIEVQFYQNMVFFVGKDRNSKPFPTTARPPLHIHCTVGLKKTFFIRSRSVERFFFFPVNVQTDLLYLTAKCAIHARSIHRQGVHRMTKTFLDDFRVDAHLHQ